MFCTLKCDIVYSCHDGLAHIKGRL